MDRELMAYLAGCMDSDGYFTIRRDTRSMRAKGRTPTHVAQIGLRQVTPQVPGLLRETFGGHLGVTKSTALNGRPLHGWHTTAVKAATACGLLLPFLRIKSAQAQVLIELQSRKGAKHVKGLPGVLRVTDEELSERDRLTYLVQRLNRTGV